ERDRSRQFGAITIVTLAADRLGERVDELVPLGLRKTRQGFLLRLEAQPTAALLGRRDPDIANSLFHRITSSPPHEGVTSSRNNVKQNVLHYCSAGTYAVMVTKNRRSAVCPTGKPRRRVGQRSAGDERGSTERPAPHHDLRPEGRRHLCRRVQDCRGRGAGDFNPKDRNGSDSAFPGANALRAVCAR